MPKGKLAIIAILALGGMVYWLAFSDSRNGNAPEPQSQAEIRHPETSSSGESAGLTFAGYDCTTDCSGHEAGYKWAEEHDITDGDDCDAAGEHSNSPSFAEGCHAYVDGDEPSSDTDPDDDNPSPDED